MDPQHKTTQHTLVHAVCPSWTGVKEFVLSFSDTLSVAFKVTAYLKTFEVRRSLIVRPHSRQMSRFITLIAMWAKVWLMLIEDTAASVS